MAQLRKSTASVAKRSQAVSSSKTRPARAKKPARAAEAAFPAEVFASAAAYEQAVASVVARIHGGQAVPRQPDV
ncbi:MAG: hypothetical protein M3Y54_07425 [Bacteroidota bacterium]|nr:hypothetical protein [Bacteroidota bacterium]